MWPLLPFTGTAQSECLWPRSNVAFSFCLAPCYLSSWGRDRDQLSTAPCCGNCTVLHGQYPLGNAAFAIDSAEHFTCFFSFCKAEGLLHTCPGADGKASQFSHMYVGFLLFFLKKRKEQSSLFFTVLLSAFLSNCSSHWLNITQFKSCSSFAVLKLPHIIFMRSLVKSSTSRKQITEETFSWVKITLGRGEKTNVKCANSKLIHSPQLCASQ